MKNPAPCGARFWFIGDSLSRESVWSAGSRPTMPTLRSMKNAGTVRHENREGDSRADCASAIGQGPTHESSSGSQQVVRASECRMVVLRAWRSRNNSPWLEPSGGSGRAVRVGAVAKAAKRLPENLSLVPDGGAGSFQPGAANQHHYRSTARRKATSKIVNL